jgi:hypothetical protein
MAYAVIQFCEAGERMATLCRLERGQPTGADGVMDPLSAFIEESSPTLLRQGSPGALYMAQLFAAREVEAGAPVRVLGGSGELGISLGEMESLEGQGFYYEVSVGRTGERTPPTVLVRAIGNTPWGGDGGGAAGTAKGPVGRSGGEGAEADAV